MKRSTLGILIVAIVAIVAIAGIIIANNNDETPNQTNTSPATTSTDTMPTMDMQQGSSNANVDQQPQQANSVEIKDFAFAPGKVSIKKGTTVTWTNRDNVRHDITPDDESEAFRGSDLLDQGESYSFTFNTAGTYTYHCSPHPYMKGTVEVTE